MICVKCGAKEETAKKKKYLQLSQEFEDLVIKNKGGHPEPDDQVCKKFDFERSIFQTFWKPDCCPDFLLLQLDTSNFAYLLIF